jgi:hypothetical protein
MPASTGEMDRLFRIVEGIRDTLTEHINDEMADLKALDNSISEKIQKVQDQIHGIEIWRAGIMAKAKMAGAVVGLGSASFFTFFWEWLKSHIFK